MKQKSPASDKKLKEVEKSSPNQFEVRDGKEDYSIRSDKDPVSKKDYPRLSETDRQNKDQSEFIDRDSNSKEEG